MIEKFYYFRKSKSNGMHRCGIAFLVKDNESVARGVSLCNDEEDPFIRDQGFIFDNKTKRFERFEGGLKKAKVRALKALNSKKNSEPIKLGKARAKVSGLGIEFKSEFNPELTTFEEKILR